MLKTNAIVNHFVLLVREVYSFGCNTKEVISHLFQQQDQNKLHFVSKFQQPGQIKLHLVGKFQQPGQNKLPLVVKFQQPGQNKIPLVGKF